MGTLMRLASLEAPFQRNENQRLVQVVFTPADLVNTRLLGVERSTYFPSGRSPVHAEGHSEEIIYFRRGRGKVLLGQSYAEVAPGDAVAIPSGIEHHVVNSGEDVLEHILVSAEIGAASAQVDYVDPGDDCLPQAQTRLLSRLRCGRIAIGRERRSQEAAYPDQESLYIISAGHAIAHVKLAGTEYEWQYALDTSSCFWVPPNIPHSFRNFGDTSLHIVQFQCRTI